MTGGNKRPRSSGMMSELDRKVHRLLRDYMIDEQAVTGAPFTFPSTSALMNYVCEVDRSLKRQKQLQLEKCIERVVPHLRRQQQEQSMASNPASSTGATEAHTSDDDAEPELDGSAKFNGLETVPTMEVRNTNAMNGSLMKLWGAKSAATAASMSTTTSVPATPRALATTTAGDLDGATDTAATTPKNTAGKGYVEANDEPEAAKTAERDARRKKRTKISDRSKYTPPDTRLSDLGGVDACIEEILELIVMPLKHPEIYLHTGVQPPRGVLLHGPPGCGKTLLANAIAGEVGVPFLQISAPSIVSGMSGESEKKLREVFEEARDVAPCIVFIDEIDAITPKRENAQREMERRIVAQMLTCIDDLSWEKTENKPVMLIGATNRPDSLDPALRRAGRFDREIAMTVPDELAREQILRVLCERLRLAGDFDMHELAKRTPGYVGADLTALTTAAGMIAVKRIFHRMQSMPVGEAAEGLATKLAEVLVEAEAIEAIDANSQAMHVDEDAAAQQGASTPASWDARPATERLRTIADFLARHPEPLTPAELEPLAITGPDFFEALKKVQPSAKREGFATVPGVTWDDIGALSSVRTELRMAVVEPIKRPEIFAQVGITAPAGVLLWGPPGNGKTLLAKAIANESHTNFISVKGGELMSKYVGDSERAVRQVFARARASSPCVIFFDELDALCSKRTGEQSEAAARVVNTLLTEIDGMESRKSVYVIAATNRPDIIDPAMLRPGRLDKLLYVELPAAEERAEILRTLAKRTPLADDVDLVEIAHHERCQGLSGADLAGLIREASVAALRSVIFDQPESNSSANIKVTRAHFQTALDRTSPSVSASELKRYESLRKLYRN